MMITLAERRQKKKVKIIKLFKLSLVSSSVILGKEPLGTFYKGKVKTEVYKCKHCSEDKELFGIGYFMRCVDRRQVFISCGCNKLYKWNEQQNIIRINRLCEKRGIKFKGWADDYKGNKTKMVLSCDDHGDWSTCTLANFLKGRSCPSCAIDRRNKSKVKEDKEQKVRDLCDKEGYTLLTPVTKSSMNKDRITLVCDKKCEPYEVTIKNFMKGRRCPSCKGKNQHFLYVNAIRTYEGETLPFFKIGIAVNVDNRISSQNNRNNFVIEPVYVFEFKDSISCKAAEQFIKQNYIKGEFPLSKEVFPDGHTEVISSDREFDIYDTVIEFGGIEIDTKGDENLYQKMETLGLFSNVIK